MSNLFNCGDEYFFTDQTLKNYLRASGEEINISRYRRDISSGSATEPQFLGGGLTPTEIFNLPENMFEDHQLLFYKHGKSARKFSWGLSPRPRHIVKILKRSAFNNFRQTFKQGTITKINGMLQYPPLSLCTWYTFFPEIKIFNLIWKIICFIINVHFVNK